MVNKSLVSANTVLGLIGLDFKILKNGYWSRRSIDAVNKMVYMYNVPGVSEKIGAADDEYFKNGSTQQYNILSSHSMTNITKITKPRGMMGPEY